MLLFLALVMGPGYLFDCRRFDVFNRNILGDYLMISMFIATVVELALLSGQILHEEIHARTLQSLMPLPLSTAEVFTGS